MFRGCPQKNSFSFCGTFYSLWFGARSRAQLMKVVAIIVTLCPRSFQLFNGVSLSLSLSLSLSFFFSLSPLQAQAAQQRAAHPPAITQGGQPYQPPAQAATPGPVSYAGLYPSLEDEYMGLQLTGYRPVSVSSYTNMHIYTYTHVSTFSLNSVYLNYVHGMICKLHVHVILYWLFWEYEIRLLRFFLSVLRESNF